MTIIDTRSHDTAVAGLSWSSPDKDLWVANLDGDYAGMVEFRDGHFIVQNHLGETVATCSSIPTAMEALESAANAAAEPAVTRFLATLTTKPNPLATRVPKTGYVRNSSTLAG